MNKIVVTALDQKFNSYVKITSVLARKVFLLLKKNNFAVDIYLAPNKEIRRINRDYRHKDEVTNVLSFCEPKDFILSPSKHKYLGEIYIAPEFIETNNQDIKLMIVHGILHLLGYDHMNRSDRDRMERREAEILGKI